MSYGGAVDRLTEEVVASATSIVADTDVIRLTGSTAIQTIVPRSGFCQTLILIPVDGTVVLGTSGNILVGISAVINRAVYLTYVKGLNKWVINSGV